MIRSFADADTELLWDTGKSRRIPASLRTSALKKIAQLDSAERLEDLWSPPGNRLEVLTGDRKGQHSIRINAQYRICFTWADGDAYDVEVVDYH
ncbi:MAG: type II toxin-antitoxin system RelE/ParE family toxin [Terracidiphilus sp.]